MDDLTALLAAIVLQPEEDTPRLAYADALRERGDNDRAEFIHVQVELEPIRGETQPVVAGPIFVEDMDAATEAFRDWHRSKDLTKREDDLFTWYNIQGWFGHRYALRHFVDPKQYEVCDVGSQILIRRGFFAEIVTDVKAFLAVADDLIWHPTQKAICSRCGGDGKAHGADRPFEWTPDPLGYQCRACHGSGKSDAPRPCPPTAQPIRRVNLTDGDFFEPSLQFYRTPDKGVRSYRWPGVEFTVPNAPAFAADDWVACGDGYLPRHRWVCEFIRRTFPVVDAITGYESRYEREIEDVPELLLSLTYTLSAQDPPLPSIGKHTFGPIRAMTPFGQYVVIEKALLREYHTTAGALSFDQVMRVEVRAEGVGSVTHV